MYNSKNTPAKIMTLQGFVIHMLFIELICRPNEINNGVEPLFGKGLRLHLFFPERILSKREEVMSMLLQLPLVFMEGGWMICDACFNRDGQRWADGPERVDQLIAMAHALGLIDHVPGSIHCIVVKEF